MDTRLFERYFTLEQAAALVPFVKTTFATAHQELESLKDEIVLYKRMHQIQEEESERVYDTQVQSLLDVLHQKWHAYEESFHSWINVLTEKGIQVKDFKRGLIDFPYKASDGTDYLLCWHLGEDGLFYFHDPYEGFQGRKPISLLPE